MTTVNIVSIIGGGAVGVSLLYQIIKKNTDSHSEVNLEINIFEKNACIGRGLAYSNDSKVSLLNRPAESMSAIHGNMSDFIHWLASNNEWKSTYPNIKLDKNSDLFLPRSLFGVYLEHLFETALVLARKNNIKVNIIHDEVINLIKKQHIYCLETKIGNAYLSHAVVLALGHTQSNNYDYLAVSQKYLASPYQQPYILNQIPKDASIAIIGSRLSAIDAVMALDECGHRGKIAFISRNGYLPNVRPNNVLNYKLKIITAKRIHEISRYGTRSLTLREVVNMIVEEVSLATGTSKMIMEWFDRPHNAEQYLEDEISKVNCQDTIIWQSVMIAINHVIELIWHKLSARDKKIFLKRYRSRWMAYRVGIPYQNAIRILSLLKEGRLSSVKGIRHIQYDQVMDKFIIQSASQSLVKTFDYTINATGFCSNINETKSTLIMNMKENGLLQASQFGGMEVDFTTSRIKDESGNIQHNLYAIGNLTEGTYFFTSVLELNIKHANVVSGLILDGFKSHWDKQTIQISQTYARDNYVSQIIL